MRGQVIETLDGKPLAERIKALEPYVTASSPAHLRHRLLERALAGPEGSQATVGVRDSSGQVKQVRFTRSLKSLQKPRKGEPYRLLGDIAYVDMTRLQASQVATLFDKVKNTRALVLDMRGAPNGAASSVVPYLNTRKARYGAVFERNLVSADETAGRYKFLQELPRARVPVYRGKTVMLVDERTSGEAEHLGLLLEAANGTTMIGSPSAGTNGELTDLVLPGGVTMTFTGHDVRHLDGRQLQRVGLRPQVFARPTLTSIKAGKDEVLERALDYLGGAGASGMAVARDTP
ncbi:hypothetical protein JRI60_18490 [Archangium violaceum]|nr:hypothetical protein JRI60_18490 [Archangium violaceum]